MALTGRLKGLRGSYSCVGWPPSPAFQADAATRVVSVVNDGEWYRNVFLWLGLVVGGGGRVISF